MMKAMAMVEVPEVASPAVATPHLDRVAPIPSEPIVMVPRADLYGGRVLLTGAGYDPEAAAIAPVEAGEFDRPTTIAGWKNYFNDLAGKPSE